MKKELLVLCGACVACGVWAAAPNVDEHEVTVKQDPFTRTVAVSYRLTGAPAIVTVDFQTNIADTATWVSIGAENFLSLKGSVNAVVQPAETEQRIQWVAGDDWPDRKLTNSFRAVVTAWALSNPPDYMVVDLLTRARKFYVSTAAIPGGVHHPDYTRSKLIMRRIPARMVTWRMGSPSLEANRAAEPRETPHYVTLTEDYYMGIFPVTCGQFNDGKDWGLSGGDNYDYPMTGTTSMTYNNIRGAGWPEIGHDLGAETALGHLRTQTGIPFDLPTEAQWEFACRAGTTSRLYTGSDDANQSSDLGWTAGNGGSLHPVGRLPANSFGLYDLYGNVGEWCLDWNAGYDVSNDACVDPKGPSTGSSRIKRGGCFIQGKECARSAYRDADGPDYSANNQGFRLCCPVTVGAFN